MMVKRNLGMDVVAAARLRIRSVFANGLPVYLSFSGGKDSLTLAHLTLELGQQGAIDLRQLTVIFIDEEAIFPCVERIVRKWRETFLMAGAKFDWYCLEVRHYSCLNMLENDESFICWDRTKEAVWIRRPPPFALRSHPLFKPAVHTYQQFLPRLNDGLNMVGVRINESVQRRLAFVIQRRSVVLSDNNLIKPIYDWSDHDVWLYLRDRDIDIPDAYLHLYAIDGAQQLRISQFFSIDTARSLADIERYYPGLMRAILKREPNAYLVSLYFHSEMFRRRTRTRRVLEQQSGTATDYRSAVKALYADAPANFPTKNHRHLARDVFRIMLQAGGTMTDDDYRDAYQILIAGDPKRRSLRALKNRIRVRYDNAQFDRSRSSPAGDERAFGPARAAQAERLQPERGAAGEPQAADPVHPD
jgi:predicted phosphoadenosine phosphosulfate sulfurtransferase